DNVGRLQRALLLQERLFAGIELGGLELERVAVAKIILLAGPASEGAGGLTNIGLGGGGDAGGEQLQEFAGENFGGVCLLAASAVEPDQHRSIGDDSGEQLGELTQSVLAEQLVLLEHEREAADFLVAGGEMAVPEQRELLAQRVRAVENVIQPPGLEP